MRDMAIMSERATIVSRPARSRVINLGRTRHAVAWRQLDELLVQRVAHFAGTVPCGVRTADGTVISMRLELGHDFDPAAAKAVIAWKFRARWQEYLGGCG